MPEKPLATWYHCLEELTRELNFELSKGKVISFHNQGCGLIKDPKRPLVYDLVLEWIGERPQRKILTTFGYEKPFFRVAENCPEHERKGRVTWAEDKPFGMIRTIGINSFVFEYNSLYAVDIEQITGEVPNLKYFHERKLCWGDI